MTARSSSSSSNRASDGFWLDAAFGEYFELADMMDDEKDGWRKKRKEKKRRLRVGTARLREKVKRYDGGESDG